MHRHIQNGRKAPRRYLEQELIEVSAVGIPANPNALTLALRAGAIEQSDLRELFQLLKHLVGRDSVEPSSIRPIPSDSSDSASAPSAKSAVAPLLPQLRFLRSLISKTTNRKENQL